MDGIYNDQRLHQALSYCTSMACIAMGVDMMENGFGGVMMRSGAISFLTNKPLQVVPPRGSISLDVGRSVLQLFTYRPAPNFKSNIETPEADIGIITQIIAETIIFSCLSTKSMCQKTRRKITVSVTFVSAVEGLTLSLTRS